MKAKMIRRISPTEHQIQAAIVEWANKTKIYDNNAVGDFLIAIPNGGYRNKFEAKRLSLQGVKAGVSDMFLAIPRIVKSPDKFYFYGGMWLEIKTHKGKVSYYQTIWQARMTGRYIALVVNGVDEGIQAIKDYLGME